jgi:hypothetical protein
MAAVGSIPAGIADAQMWTTLSTPHGAAHDCRCINVEFSDIDVAGREGPVAWSTPARFNYARRDADDRAAAIRCGGIARGAIRPRTK